MHGDRNYTHPHPSPWFSVPSPPVPTEFHCRPHPSPWHFIPIPTHPRSKFHAPEISSARDTASTICFKLSTATACCWGGTTRKLFLNLGSNNVAMKCRGPILKYCCSCLFKWCFSCEIMRLSEADGVKCFFPSPREPRKIDFHLRGIPATFFNFVPIPAGFPRIPRDSRHPDFRAHF